MTGPDAVNNELNPRVLWLDHIKAVARKMGFDPLDVGMSKLKGTMLCTINAVSKAGDLSWFQFSQLLIEHYWNMLYALDVLNTYAPPGAG